MRASSADPFLRRKFLGGELIERDFLSSLYAKEHSQPLQERREAEQIHPQGLHPEDKLPLHRYSYQAGEASEKERWTSSDSWEAKGDYSVSL